MMGQVDGQHDTWHQRHHWHLDNPCRRLNLLWSCGVSCQVVLFWVKKNGFSRPWSTPLSISTFHVNHSAEGRSGKSWIYAFYTALSITYHRPPQVALSFWVLLHMFQTIEIQFMEDISREKYLGKKIQYFLAYYPSGCLKRNWLAWMRYMWILCICTHVFNFSWQALSFSVLFL